MSEYYDKLNIKYGILTIILVIILLGLIIYMHFLKVYSVYNSIGYFEDGFLIINIEMDNSDVVNNKNYLKINNQKYKYDIFEKSNLLIENNINYYSYKLKVSDYSFEENKIENITFYYNKENLIKKIAKIIV